MTRVLALLVMTLSMLLYGYANSMSSGTPGGPQDKGDWVELAPGMRYQIKEGGVNLEYTPPLFTEEGVKRFETFTRDQAARAASEEEKEFWNEQIAFVKEQYTNWADEDRVVKILEYALLSRFPLPLTEGDRQALRVKLGEIVKQMKQGVNPGSLPEQELPAQLRAPGGGMMVGPENFHILVSNLEPQSFFPACSLAASAMPTTASPGAKAYATASCSTNSIIWGSVETRTSARAGNDWPPPCSDSGWPFSQCMSVAYGNTNCQSYAWAGYYYQWQDLKYYSDRRSSSNSSCR
ncbi:hypothetical protein [Thermus scotoductus]|uniref:hypothetical protein n=1 Tax=Thermus scotoductus TaxID=37636 RepID=UPI000F7E7570|nr:hypothetical protein [Thermus scotoductus]